MSTTRLDTLQWGAAEGKAWVRQLQGAWLAFTHEHGAAAAEKAKSGDEGAPGGALWKALQKAHADLKAVNEKLADARLKMTGSIH